MEKLGISKAMNVQGKKVLFLFMLTTMYYIFMISITIPKVMEYTDGMPLFDMMPLGYDLDYATNLLDELGTEGRKGYKYGQLPFDMVYPALFGITYCLLLAYFSNKLDRFTKWYSYLCLLPLIAGIADYAENLGIVTLLNSYPKISQSTVTITSSFSLLKSMCTTLTFLTLIGILIVLGIKTLKKMKKQVIITFVTILITFYSQAQKEVGKVGTFKGVFTHGNFTDTISFEIKKDSTEWQVFFSSLAQNAFQIPARNVTVIGDSINFVLQSDKYIYDFANILNENRTKLAGRLKVDSVKVNYILEKQDLTNKNGTTTEEVYFKSNGLKFAGTIWKPEKPNKKAIVFITSSGGGDRSGSRAEAIYFAEKGFTTFHYDKRGTGLSGGSWQSATMEELSSDDMNAIHYFSEQTSIPISQIGIKGSSQGAAKVPYILYKLKELNFGIAVGCPGSTLLESDLNYWKNRNRQVLGDNLENASRLQKKVFEHIAGKIPRTELEKTIEFEKSKSWFSSVWIPNLDEVQTDEKLLYSGILYFEKTAQPLLIIQGTDDEIIPIESHEVIAEALEKANNKKYKIVLLPNANHSIYNTGKSDFPYWARLHDGYLETINKWMNAISQ